MNEAQRGQIVSILAAANDLTLATLRPDGWPQATVVSFVNDGPTIYFGAGAQAQKAQNIARDDRVSIAVTAPYGAWDDIRGLSIGGRARRVTDPAEVARVGELMFKKFPQISKYAEFGDGLDMALFRIDAHVISILDYSQGFGHTEFVTMS